MYPPYQNTGTPVGLDTLKPGAKYRCEGHSNENTILDVMGNYLKIKRQDRWIINLSFTNPMYKQVVYIDKEAKKITSNSIKNGEIVLCNIEAVDIKGKSYTQQGVVFSCSYEGYSNVLKWSDSHDKRFISLLGAEEDLTITKIEILQHLGFKNKSKSFTEVVASDEKRNNITGAYE